MIFFSSPESLPVFVTLKMHPWYMESTSLTEKEVNSIENGIKPDISINGERI
jgi:hypothetical protein